MITVTGLGPGTLDRVPEPVRDLLLDPDRMVIARTSQHPAAAELARLREVVFCDDLYESAEGFDDVYTAIAERVIAASESRSVVYAVPGSPMMGEFAVRKIIDRAEQVEVISGESFVDAVLAEMGYDPLDRGLQILNGHDLPDPLILDKPTIIGHLDSAEILGDVLDSVGRVVPEEVTVTLCSSLGSTNSVVVSAPVAEIRTSLAGLRTSLFIDCEPGGLVGAVKVMRRLREECPWDREQTHHSLVKNLIEETYELIEAIGRLPQDDIDLVAYASVEDELGDVLLQVLFHEAIAREEGAFDIDGVAGVLREKLIRRHPHIFAAVEVSGAEEVKENWDRIKQGEGPGAAGSLVDGVPAGMPSLQRASKIQNRVAKVGFDWETAALVVPKIQEEIEELGRAMAGDGSIENELGDLLFSVVNLARHLHIDPEIALRRATTTFEDRFRRMERTGPLDGLGLEELNRRWDAAKSE